jgi:hypothetical protein
MMRTAQCAVIGFCFFGFQFAVAAGSAKDQYAWCWSASLKTEYKKVFYSAIFVAEPSERQEMQVAYGKYVNRTYADDDPGPGMCNLYANRDAAESSSDTSKKNDRWYEKEVVETGWTYTP